MKSNLDSSKTHQDSYYTGNILDKPGSKDSKNASTTIKDFVLGHKFVDSLQKFDNANNHDQLVQYFAIVGMDDADALYTVMTVKEMLYSGYGLNPNQLDAQMGNHGILTGDRPFIGDTRIFSKSKMRASSSGMEIPLPRFQVPRFQPRVLSRVPSIERSKLLFPINFADFVFKDGVQVMSLYEVEKRHAERERNGPFDHESAHIPSFGNYPTPQNDMQREMLYTNQEGKMYYAACFDYFVDLSEIEADLRAQGHFYVDECAEFEDGEMDPSKALEAEELASIMEQAIPPRRYYLPFTMCLLSLKSYRTQYLAILEALYRSQVGRGVGADGHKGGKTFEEAVNSIVFGVPSPPRRFEYFSEYFKKVSSSSSQSSQSQPATAGKDHKPLVELCLYPPEGKYEGKKIYLQNENPFDIASSRYENIWVLLQTLTAENVLQLFKRLLFNTCNILVSQDATTLSKCIQGIVELFYPLSCDLICIPNLPLSMLEYVNMCGQCVLGVVQRPKEQRKSAQGSNSVSGAGGIRKSDVSKTPRVTVVRDEDIIDLFDIMQDNACQMDLDQNHSIQKPRQVVAFNTKGRLAQGQGAAQSSGGRATYSQQSSGQLHKMNQHPQGNAKQGGGPENLNDIELPKESSRSIKQALQKAQREQMKLSAALEASLSELARAHKRRPETSKQEDEQRRRIAQLEADIHSQQLAMQARVREVKYEFYTMIKKVLQAYCYDGKSHGGLPSVLLPEFKGGATQSGHMPKYIRWQARRDIFQLVEKRAFKRDAKTADGQLLYPQLFYQRLIYYPSLQNFISEKFFPNSIDDNIRQLHAHPEVAVPEDSASILPGGKRASLGSASQPGLSRAQQKAQKKLDKEQERDINSGQTGSSSAEINLAASLFGNDIARAGAHRLGPVRCTGSFPRHLDENRVRADFLKSHNTRLVQNLTRHDVRLAAVLERPGSELDIAPVVDMKVRVALYFEQLTPKVNIIIAWLFLFLGSLEYQLNPTLFTRASTHKLQKDLDWQTYKSPAHYDSQAKVEQLLAKDFEKVLKMLVYKFNYDFNPRCPLLSLLFQYTHKYGFLHQKLIDVVHQDVDQQQGGGGAGGSMCVSNSFVVYQLHWESRQFRLAAEEEKKLKQWLRNEAAGELAAQRKAGRAEAREGTKGRSHQQSRTHGGADSIRESSAHETGHSHRQKGMGTADELLQWAKDVAHEREDLAIADPYVLNEKLERKWEYNADRLALLRELGEADQRENVRNGQGLESQEQRSQADYADDQLFMAGSGAGARPHRGASGRSAGAGAWFGKLFRRGGEGASGGLGSKQSKAERAALREQLGGRGSGQHSGGSGKHGSSKSGKGQQDPSQKHADPRQGQDMAYQDSEESKTGPDENKRDGQNSRRAHEAYFPNFDSGGGEQGGFEDREIFTNIKEQALRARSFISPSTFQRAKQKAAATQAGEPHSGANLGLHIELDLVPAEGAEIDNETQALLSLKNKKVSKGPGAGAKIEVTAASNYGAFALHRVDLLEPIALRGGVQTILGIDKSYKTLQSLDLSAFLKVAEETEPSDKSDQQLYWNLVFWFKFTQLPVRWMAPFLEHLTGESDIPTTASSRVNFRGVIAGGGQDELADITGSLPAYLDPDDPKEFWAHQLRKRSEGQESTKTTTDILTETNQQQQDAIAEGAIPKPQAAQEPLTPEEKLARARQLKEAHAQGRRERKKKEEAKVRARAETMVEPSGAHVLAATLDQGSILAKQPSGASRKSEESASKEIREQLAGLGEQYNPWD